MLKHTSIYITFLHHYKPHAAGWALAYSFYVTLLLLFQRRITLTYGLYGMGSITAGSSRGAPSTQPWEGWQRRSQVLSTGVTSKDRGTKEAGRGQLTQTLRTTILTRFPAQGQRAGSPGGPSPSDPVWPLSGLSSPPSQLAPSPVLLSGREARG